MKFNGTRKKIIKYMLDVTVCLLVLFMFGTSGAMEKDIIGIGVGAFRIIVAAIMCHICITVEQII